jgi:signal transduction histidine kinase
MPELPNIMVDKLRIKQVLLNLLSNAVKFTPEYGFIRVDVLRKDNEIEVRVKDTGIGISREDMDKLFIPFSRVESDVTRKYRGTGLGLAISSGLVEQHGGKIWVESEGHDRGSTFAFTLPINK